MNIFNAEYMILDKIADLMNIEVKSQKFFFLFPDFDLLTNFFSQIFSNDPFPKVICTDCYSNLVIFNEFKNIGRNSESLLKKYQINKTESSEQDTSHGKSNGKCKSIRNSEEMANRIKECAYKKSLTFIENMKNFYFLLNQFDESNEAQVIIKNELSTDSLIPTVEINIKNEVIYPNDENQQQVIIGSVIQNHQQQESAPAEVKRKKRKNNKRKAVNGQTMEIDESGNIVARQIVTSQDHQHHHSNIHLTQSNDNDMALMLTVKQNDGHHDQRQPQTITVTNHHHIQPIQIHTSKSFVKFFCVTRD